VDRGYRRRAITNRESDALGTIAAAVPGSEHARKTSFDSACGLGSVEILDALSSRICGQQPGLRGTEAIQLDEKRAFCRSTVSRPSRPTLSAGRRFLSHAPTSVSLYVVEACGFFRTAEGGNWYLRSQVRSNQQKHAREGATWHLQIIKNSLGLLFDSHRPLQ